MKVHRRYLWATSFLLLSSPLGRCLSPTDIPSDTPIASLVASAKSQLASGAPKDALLYFDAAIARAPEDYLTIFQRGATYLSLGKSTLATADFDRVLSIKPDFEGALLQRARIKSRSADWVAAKQDWEKAGKTSSEEYKELGQAEEMARLALEAEKTGAWPACVDHANTALLVASADLRLRRTRARCHFEQGNVLEGVGDMQHVLQLAPDSTESYLQVSSMLFYAVGDTEKGLTTIRSCLHSDPESKPCKKLHRQQKNIDKKLKKIAQLEEKRQYSNAAKIVVGEGEDTGLLEDVKTEIKEAKAVGTIYPSSPNDFYARLVEKTCYLYNEVSKPRSGNLLLLADNPR